MTLSRCIHNRRDSLLTNCPFWGIYYGSLLVRKRSVQKRTRIAVNDRKEEDQMQNTETTGFGVELLKCSTCGRHDTVTVTYTCPLCSQSQTLPGPDRQRLQRTGNRGSCILHVR